MSALIVLILSAFCSIAAAYAGAPPPRVEASRAGAIGPRGAIVYGTINPHGRRLHYWIAFGRQRPSEHHTGLSEEELGGNEPEGVEEVVEGLLEGTTYRYRLVAVYGHETKKSFGPEGTFRTKCYGYNSQGEVAFKNCRR